MKKKNVFLSLRATTMLYPHNILGPGAPAQVLRVHPTAHAPGADRPLPVAVAGLHPRGRGRLQQDGAAIQQLLLGRHPPQGEEHRERATLTH